jgi:hypothetical protein
MNRASVYASAARSYAGFGRQHSIGSIAWEERPSLADALRRGEFSTTSGSAWSSTEAVALQALESEAAPGPFVEVLAGLQMREITGDEVFRHFFGILQTH